MTETIKIVIVDDELPARQRLLDLIEKEADVEIIGVCANGYDAIDTIKGKNPDLVLLDIQMPEVDGFNVITQVGIEQMPIIIFVTAYDQHALRAFEIYAFDYLLKPYDDERFKNTLERAKQHILLGRRDNFTQKLLNLIETHKQQQTNLHVQKKANVPSTIEHFVVKMRGEILFIKVKDVDYIKGAGVYVSLHIGKKSYLLRERMNTLEVNLDKCNFFRIHRSTIVNMDRIKKLQPYFNGDYIVILHDGTELKLSRSRREAFQTCLGLTF